MGKVTELVDALKKIESITTEEVFRRYPHLVEMQKAELWEEFNNKSLTESKKKDLLLD